MFLKFLTKIEFERDYVCACAWVWVERVLRHLWHILRHDWFHAHGVPCVSSGEDVASAAWRIDSCSHSRADLNGAKILLQFCHSCCLEPSWHWHWNSEIYFYLCFPPNPPHTLSYVTWKTDKLPLRFKSTFDSSVLRSERKRLWKSKSLSLVVFLLKDSSKLCCGWIGFIGFLWRYSSI